MNSKIPTACPGRAARLRQPRLGSRAYGSPSSQAKKGASPTQSIRAGIFCQHRPPERRQRANLPVLVLVGTAPAPVFELGNQ